MAVEVHSAHGLHANAGQRREIFKMEKEDSCVNRPNSVMFHPGTKGMGAAFNKRRDASFLCSRETGRQFRVNGITVKEISWTVDRPADSGASYRFQHSADGGRLLMRQSPARGRAGARLP